MKATETVSIKQVSDSLCPADSGRVLLGADWFGWFVVMVIIGGFVVMDYRDRRRHWRRRKDEARAAKEAAVSTGEPAIVFTDTYPPEEPVKKDRPPNKPSFTPDLEDLPKIPVIKEKTSSPGAQPDFLDANRDVLLDLLGRGMRADDIAERMGIRTAALRKYMGLNVLPTSRTVRAALRRLGEKRLTAEELQAAGDRTYDANPVRYLKPEDRPANYEQLRAVKVEAMLAEGRSVAGVADVYGMSVGGVYAFMAKHGIPTPGARAGKPRQLTLDI